MRQINRDRRRPGSAIHAKASDPSPIGTAADTDTLAEHVPDAVAAHPRETRGQHHLRLERTGVCGGRWACHSRAMVQPANLGAMRAVRANFTSSLLLLALAGCAGQQPQQVSVPSPSPAPTDGAASCSQVGMASWYRGSSRGRTSSLDLVAAHRSLPFGTSVQVTAIETGHSVVVRINDRGPTGRGRIIDLSRVAADRLGMRHDGVARVRLELVGSDGGGCPFQQAWLD